MQKVILDKNGNAVTLSLGANLVEDGCYFSFWSPEAAGIRVHIYDSSEKKIKVAELTERKAGMWFGHVDGVKPGMMYAVEALGEENIAKGLYFKEGRYLVDPYAKALNKPFNYTDDMYKNHNEEFIPKAILGTQPFDWQGVSKPFHDRDGIILYETHVKGFSKLNKDIPENIRGTYLGLAHESSINHLKSIGITAVQLMPVAASMSEPTLTKNGLSNYWGYNPVCFMAPDPRYASDPANAINEFKTMVRELHRVGISVILDVVYNHTAEGNQDGPVLSFKGLMNRYFYAFERSPQGGPDYERFTNVTGCGNSIYVDGRFVLNVVLDSLRYWLSEMQVDGFRFDLATTVNRESRGSEIYSFYQNSSFFKSCYCDDIISQAIMIAEPWDIGPGGYRLGGFPIGWSEQNDRFRDTVRSFWRGDSGTMGEFATRLLGSRDIFMKNVRSINASVNFVTYHDGFTLHDLVTYERKHNEANGENNRDGNNNNISANYGVEGETDDPDINARRYQAKRNFMASVILSQGMPHFVYGDECSRTQKGNNNAYCQDNEISWLNWDKITEEDRTFMKFVSKLCEVRRNSQMMRELNLDDDNFHLLKSSYFAKWYHPSGAVMKSEDWAKSDSDSILLFLGNKSIKDELWCYIVNRTDNDLFFTLPALHGDKATWKVMIDSSEPDGVAKRFSSENHLECVCAANSLKVIKAENTDEHVVSEKAQAALDKAEHERIEQHRRQIRQGSTARAFSSSRFVNALLSKRTEEDITIKKRSDDDDKKPKKRKKVDNPFLQGSNDDDDDK